MTTMAASGERRSVHASDQSEQLISFLKSPIAYLDGTAAVEVIETHISWLFLTDRFVYKLKKNIRFDFLDFSTTELRNEACQNEVKLNTRLAPGVYVGVIPIVRTANGGLAIDRAGTPVDWLVKMKPLPANAALDVLIRTKANTAAAIEDLAKILSTFYFELPPVTVTIESYRRAILRHAIANREELASSVHRLDSAAIRRIHAALLRVLKLAPSLLDDRVRNGRIVEGHGDLRPEHIYFDPSPVIIDCIEFSREFRTLDVLDELAFLSMECDFLGAPGIAAPVLERYAEQNGDPPMQQLFDFYRIYRASVRAKVCALRAEQLSGEDRSRCIESATEYLALADQYTRMLGPPVLILVHGLPGTGKSTMAETISEELGIELLQTDTIREQLFGRTTDRVGFNENRYAPENRARVYEHMNTLAGELLKDGLSVVLDGTFLTSGQRCAAMEVARNRQAQFLSVHCQCPHEMALQRISERARRGDSSSETRPEFFEQQQQDQQRDPPGFSSLSVDTSSGLGEPIRDVFEVLRTMLFNEPV